jgi:ABC-type sugar transport system ATPase subunit
MAEIELRGLTKRFGRMVAVNDVDLEVEAGEVMCLLGPSGCGKTTTLRMIAGLEWASAGDILIRGKRVNALRPAERDIAMVFQFYALYPSLTVAENLAFPLHAERLKRAEIAARVARIARLLELEHVLDRVPGRLAEGEKQRVAVGRAVIRDPSCFLFDEPLSRLDIALRQEMRGQIKTLLGGLRRATVIVTHDQIEALTIGNRIAVMREGVIEQVATPHEIFATPANAFVAGFIGTPQMNLLAAERLADRSGRLSLRLLGQELTLPVAAGTPGLPAIGGSLTVGVRPRAFEPASESAADCLSGVIDVVEPLGAETLVHLAAGGTDIRVVLPRGSGLGPGARLNVRPLAGQIHLFDAEERRITT